MTTAGEASAVSTESIHMHVTMSSGALKFQSLSVDSPDESSKKAVQADGLIDLEHEAGVGVRYP